MGTEGPREESTVRPTRRRAGLVFTVSAAHFVHDTFTALLAPLLPLLIQNLGMSLLQAGSLTVVMQAPSVLNPVIGSLADKYGLNRVLVICAPGATGVLMCLIGIAPNYAVLAVLMLTVGFSVSAIHVAGPVLVSQVARDSVGRGMSFFMVGGELARTAGPLFAVQLVATFGMQGMWRIAPAAAVSSLLLWWRFAGMGAPRPAERPSRLVAVFRKMRKTIGVVLALLLARAFMVAALTTFLPTFVYGQGKSLLLANASLSVLELCGAAGAMTSGTLSDKLGRGRVLKSALALAPPLMLLFTFSDGLPRMFVLAALGFVALSTTPVLMAVMIENSGANAAAANGIFMMMSFGIRGLVVLLVGAMGDAWGLRGAFLVCTAFAALGFPFTFLLPRPAPRR